MSKKTEREIQDEIRKELEGLLGDDPIMTSSTTSNQIKSGNVSDVAIDGGTDLGDRLQHPFAQPMNFHDIKEEAAKDARKTLKTLMDFYLGSKIIKKNEYVKYKQKVDEMSLSNMMFAIKTSQHAIIKLLEEIDMGNTHPRNFEAMATLNNQMMNMIKHQQALFVTMEEGYKKIKGDHEMAEAEDRTEDQDAVVVNSGPLKTRGTRMLMQNLRKKIESAPKDEQSADKPRLTDARSRPANPMDGVGGPVVDSEDDIYGDLDEHF